MNKNNRGNILSFEMCQSLDLLQVAKVSTVESFSNKNTSVINKLTEKYKEVFNEREN